MGKYQRVFLIVLDSLGIGAMPDAKRFGDTGADTLGHISDTVAHLNIPNLQKLGLANLHPSNRYLLLNIPWLVVPDCLRKATAKTQ